MGTYWNLESGSFKSPGFSVINIDKNNDVSNPDWESHAYFRGELSAATGSFSGEITASGGEIAGWIITDDKIYKDVPATGNIGHQYVHISSNFYTAENQIPFNPVFWVRYGDVDTFYVRSNGELYAKKAKISGEVIASSGRIGVDANGNGGWYITGNEMYITNGQNNTVYFRDGSNAYQDILVVKTNGGGYPFYLHADGYLHAENVDITGTINATGGTFTGTITCYGTISGANISGGTISGAIITTTGVNNGY